MWRNELKNAAIPLFSVLLGGVISIAAVYVQGRMNEQRENLLTRKEKIEMLLSLALQVESSLNKMPARLKTESAGDYVDIAHQLRTMVMLSEVYFPTLKEPTDAYAKKTFAALDGLAACAFRSELNLTNRQRCYFSAIESVPTHRELEALFAGARSELGQLGQ
ncbi:hypothetical protein ACLBKS_16315 [Hylemonella sp. W303a]|uniref:hypothetical protein n=1 Tax=Hylemonella sp. W303a TaxID=3389873 RepID=UPI00396AFC5C